MVPESASSPPPPFADPAPLTRKLLLEVVADPSNVSSAFPAATVVVIRTPGRSMSAITMLSVNAPLANVQLTVSRAPSVQRRVVGSEPAAQPVTLTSPPALTTSTSLSVPAATVSIESTAATPLVWFVVMFTAVLVIEIVVPACAAAGASADSAASAARADVS